MRTKLLLMSVILTMFLNQAWGQSIQVIPVPHQAMNPTIPHFAYNGHPTTFKAIARNGIAGQVFYYRWDVNGDGIGEPSMSKTPPQMPGGWYQGAGTELDLVFLLPYVDPNITQRMTFIATLEVATSVDALGRPQGSKVATYPVTVFADVPSLGNANSATPEQLYVMKEVAIDDALWALHKKLVRGSLPSAQMTGYIDDSPQSTTSTQLANTALFALAMLENGHLGAYPPGTYNSYGIPAPTGFLSNNDFRYNNDPYSEDVTRAINFLLLNIGTYSGVPVEDEADDGGTPISGTNDEKAFYVGDTWGYETINTALPVAAIAKSGLGGTAAQIGGSFVIGKSMEYVVQQLVDHIVFSQIDAGANMGGWSYAPNDGSNPACSYNSGGWYYALNSAEQAMGQFGVRVNNRVKNRIPNMLRTNQDPASGGPRLYSDRSSSVFEPAGLSLLACKWLGWDTFSVSDETPAGYLPDPTTPKKYYRQVYDNYLRYVSQSWTTATSDFYYFSASRVLWKDGNYNSASPCASGNWSSNLWTFSLFAVKQAAQTGVPISSFGTHDWRHEFRVSLAKGQSNSCDLTHALHPDFYADASSSLMRDLLGGFATTAYAVLAMSEQGQNGPVAVASASPMQVIEACSGPSMGKVTFQHSGSFHPDAAHRIVEYRWNFNTAAGSVDWGSIPSDSYSADGRAWKGSSPAATPFCSYLHAGTYSAELTVVDDQDPPQMSSILVKDIKVLPMPPASPTASAGGPYYIPAGTDLTLAGSATDPNTPCGDVLTYSWDLNNDGVFGDAAGATPTVSWAQLVALGLNQTSGQPHTIKLNVTDGTALTHQASTTLTIVNTEPIALFTAQPATAGCNVPITFDASTSFVGDAARTIVSYSWDFGDGTNASGKVVVHPYMSYGSFTVALTIKDDVGRTASATRTVDVPLVNIKPVANPGGPYTLIMGNALTLDGTGSSDPNSPCDAVASYSWDINNDNVFGDFTGPTPTIPAGTTSGWRVGGVYVIALRVTDNFGLLSDISTTQVTVVAAPFLALPINGATGVSVSPTTFTWIVFEGATSYSLQYSTDAGFATAVTISSIANTSQQVTDLANNTLYYWRVNAATVGGTSAWSSVWNFRTKKGTASVSPDAASKVYGTSDPPLTGILAGFNTRDGVTATYSRTSGESVAGSPYTISATLAPLSVLDNYEITYNTANFTINKATVTANVTVENRAYDGTRGATITGRVLSNVVGSDDVTLTGGSATFDDANAGDGKTVTVTGLGLSGAAAGNYELSSTTVTTKANIAKTDQTVTWANPADIVYGTLLSPAQLNATVVGVPGGSAPGALTYAPPAGTLLNAGNGQALSVTAAATENYNSAIASATINVLKAAPVITWANPADITYGTLLSATQLNAAADVPGEFVYTPALGTKLNAGAGQDLKVDFTPTDAANYSPVTMTVKINVLGAAPVITWANPADITYGMLLSATQLNAAADVPGVFVYTPALGTKLNAGAGQDLKVDFTPTDVANYSPVTMTVKINVLKATPTVTVTGGTFTYDGTPHAATASATGLEGETVSGSFAFVYIGTGSTTYGPSSMPPTNDGTYSVSAEFTSTSTNYANATGSGSITIVKATAQLPELLVRFDVQKTDIVVLDVATLTPVAPQLPDPVKNQMNQADRSYRLTNPNGAWIEIIVQVKNVGHSCQTEILSIAYSSSAKITHPGNALKVEWVTDKLDALKELQQKVELKPTLQVEAKYDAKANSTKINIHHDGLKMDKDLTSPDVALIGVATDKGALRYYGPGSETTSSSPSLAGHDEEVTVEQPGEITALPTEYALHNAYPNPFNPSTTIRFDLPEAAKVRLAVYDLLGREVAVLADEERQAGQHSVRFRAAGLSSGMYFFRLWAGNFTQTKKLMLLN